MIVSSGNLFAVLSFNFIVTYEHWSLPLLPRDDL